MAAVKQSTLNWMYSVLTKEYRDVDRTYNDIAQTLSHYSSLSPRTAVYTYEHGTSALLLNLYGTLPATFRGTVYRFPVDIWIPHPYPREAPIVYVKPTEDIVLRPGQHVDPQGKIYHPYLVAWAEYWDKSNVLDFLAILREVFAKEPPVIARQQQNIRPYPQQTVVPPPVPPLPPGVGRTSSASSSSTSNQQTQPPLLPPKPTSSAQGYSSHGPSRRDINSPLPSLPGQLGNQRSQYGSHLPPNDTHGHLHAPQRSSSLRYETAPPLPPQPYRQHALQEASHSSGSVSPMTPEESHRRQSISQPYQQSLFNPGHPHPAPNQHQQPPSYYQQPSLKYNTLSHGGQEPPPAQPYPYPSHPQPPPSQSHPTQPHQPAPDLLDAPLTLTIPTSTPNLPAPPVPSNPEKDMLLSTIGRALLTQRQHTASQTTSSLPGLHAQHTAMLTSLQSMQSEISALELLTSLLNSNTDILHTALRDADSMISSSQHRTAPSIDEILVAPTVVGNQLYELISEERSLGDALFVLSRAVERGRVSPAVFAKMTRSLAREWYLKKALAKKIARGMGLVTY
ncbi:ESCRT-I component [Calycina marina]|uniref:ESCRT-I component n=1 Tax=Calycina marina TaxID=1763456 RepID=A0A9P7YX52_9HELO|nr:ESCRT-I component [Calycina marina]